MPQEQDAIHGPTIAYARFSRRFLALVLDAAILATTLAVVLVAAAALDADAAVRIAMAITLLGALLYDPVSVSIFGGTLGHRLLNLRVVADDGANVSFGPAVVRAVVKGLLGVISFVFMGATRRHQALHDLASRSTVQLRDLTRARPAHYARERVLPDPAGVSRMRRVLVTFAYVTCGFLLMSVAGGLMVSEACLLDGICSPADELRSELFAWGWLGFSAFAMIAGWRGRLPGCRSRSPAA